MSKKVYPNFWNLLAWLYVMVLANGVLKDLSSIFEDEIKLNISDMSRHVNTEVCPTYHGAEHLGRMY